MTRYENLNCGYLWLQIKSIVLFSYLQFIF